MKKDNKSSKQHLFEIMDKLNLPYNKTVLNEEDKWIQKAVDPEHKGYCTPMTKDTCTPHRKALAKRFKKGIDEEGEKWEQGAVKHPGALHKELGTPEDEKIPMDLINRKLADLKEKAKGDKKLSDKELKTLQRLNLAKTFKKQQNEENVPGMDNYMERMGFTDENIRDKVEKMKSTIDQLVVNHEYETLDALVGLILGKKHRFGANNVSEDHSPEHKKKIDLMKGKLDFYFDNDHYDIIDQLEQIFNKLYTDKVPETEPELYENGEQ